LPLGRNGARLVVEGTRVRPVGVASGGGCQVAPEQRILGGFQGPLLLFEFLEDQFGEGRELGGAGRHLTDEPFLALDAGGLEVGEVSSEVGQGLFVGRLPRQLVRGGEVRGGEEHVLL